MKKAIIVGAISLLTCITSINALAKVQYIPAQLVQFENTGVCVNCDLSDAVLPGWDNANLSNSLLVDADLSNKGFYTSNFSHAQVTYADLVGIQASGSNFDSTDFTGSNLADGNFSSCDFTGANLTGANLANAILARAIVSADQLATAKSLSCTIMPDGSKHAPDKGSIC